MADPAHIAYWNLTEDPFRNVAEPRFAYLSDQHREALARMLYLVDGRKLGGTLCGPYGVGKSLVLELLSEEIKRRDSVRFLRVDAGPDGPLPLARQTLRRLGWSEPVQDLSQALFAFEELCSESRAAFSHLALAIDEAQMLRGEESLAFLHLLTNLRSLRRDGSYAASSVTLLLSGPMSVLDAVAGDDSLHQRLQVSFVIEPLDGRQTAEYVQYRIRRAGGDIWMFDRDALDALRAASGGVPRRINNVCDVAMVLGCAAGIRRIDAGLIRQAASALGPAPRAAGSAAS